MTLPDGGLPFALPVPDPAACAPFWAQADPATSSLQITAVVAATAYRVAAVDPAVAEHPWLRAGDGVLPGGASRRWTPTSHAMELAFAVQFLDAAGRPRSEEARSLLDRLAPARSRPTGCCTWPAAPTTSSCARWTSRRSPGGPARELFAPAVVEAELDRLAAGQQHDGGWTVDFDSYSPAATLEWRGHRTVNALVLLLRANGRL